jgi:hypothetical protein
MLYCFPFLRLGVYPHSTSATDQYKTLSPGAIQQPARFVCLSFNTPTLYGGDSYVPNRLPPASEKASSFSMRRTPATKAAD